MYTDMVERLEAALFKGQQPLRVRSLFCVWIQAARRRHRSAARH